MNILAVWILERQKCVVQPEQNLKYHLGVGEGVFCLFSFLSKSTMGWEVLLPPAGISWHYESFSLLIKCKIHVTW